MTFLKTSFIAIFFALALTGCKEKITYSYLMKHPALLDQETQRCHKITSPSPEQASECDVVMHAALNFKAIFDEQQSDPEKFGQQVLDDEANCVKLRTARDQAKQALLALQAKHATDKEIQSAETNLAQAEKTYADQHEAVEFALAVIGVSSPE